MVVIRLARGGARNRPFCNIVVADSRMPRDGRFIERIGFLNPKAPEGTERYRIALDRVEHWVKNGAKPSDAVMKVVREGQKSIAKPA